MYQDTEYVSYKFVLFFLNLRMVAEQTRKVHPKLNLWRKVFLSDSYFGKITYRKTEWNANAVKTLTRWGDHRNQATQTMDIVLANWRKECCFCNSLWICLCIKFYWNNLDV